ncbi:MAG: hypothetical protein PVG30_09230 [Gammaproteobacteria bacterium]|jgi:hypothetical protein
MHKPKKNDCLEQWQKDMINMINKALSIIPENPVVIECGCTFEKKKIEQHLKTNNNCPCCKSKINNKSTITNFIVKNLKDWVKQNAIIENLHRIFTEPVALGPYIKPVIIIENGCGHTFNENTCTDLTKKRILTHYDGTSQPLQTKTCPCCRKKFTKTVENKMLKQVQIKMRELINQRLQKKNMDMNEIAALLELKIAVSGLKITLQDSTKRDNNLHFEYLKYAYKKDMSLSPYKKIHFMGCKKFNTITKSQDNMNKIDLLFENGNSKQALKLFLQNKPYIIKNIEPYQSIVIEASKTNDDRFNKVILEFLNAAYKANLPKLFCQIIKHKIDVIKKNYPEYKKIITEGCKAFWKTIDFRLIVEKLSKLALENKDYMLFIKLCQKNSVLVIKYYELFKDQKKHLLEMYTQISSNKQKLSTDVLDTLLVILSKDLKKFRGKEEFSKLEKSFHNLVLSNEKKILLDDNSIDIFLNKFKKLSETDDTGIWPLINIFYQNKGYEYVKTAIIPKIKRRLQRITNPFNLLNCIAKNTVKHILNNKSPININNLKLLDLMMSFCAVKKDLFFFNLDFYSSTDDHFNNEVTLKLLDTACEEKLSHLFCQIIKHKKAIMIIKKDHKKYIEIIRKGYEVFQNTCYHTEIVKVFSELALKNKNYLLFITLCHNNSVLVIKYYKLFKDQKKHLLEMYTQISSNKQKFSTDVLVTLFAMLLIEHKTHYKYYLWREDEEYEQLQKCVYNLALFNKDKILNSDFTDKFLNIFKKDINSYDDTSIFFLIKIFCDTKGYQYVKNSIIKKVKPVLQQTNLANLFKFFVKITVKSSIINDANPNYRKISINTDYLKLLDLVLSFYKTNNNYFFPFSLKENIGVKIIIRQALLRNLTNIIDKLINNNSFQDTYITHKPLTLFLTDNSNPEIINQSKYDLFENLDYPLKPKDAEKKINEILYKLYVCNNGEKLLLKQLKLHLKHLKKASFNHVCYYAFALRLLKKIITAGNICEMNFAKNLIGQLWNANRDSYRNMFGKKICKELIKIISDNTVTINTLNNVYNVFNILCESNYVNGTQIIDYEIIKSMDLIAYKNPRFLENAKQLIKTLVNKIPEEKMRNFFFSIDPHLSYMHVLIKICYRAKKVKQYFKEMISKNDIHLIEESIKSSRGYILNEKLHNMLINSKVYKKLFYGFNPKFRKSILKCAIYNNRAKLFDMLSKSVSNLIRYKHYREAGEKAAIIIYFVENGWFPTAKCKERFKQWFIIFINELKNGKNCTKFIEGILSAVKFDTDNDITNLLLKYFLTLDFKVKNADLLNAMYSARESHKFLSKIIPSPSTIRLRASFKKLYINKAPLCPCKIMFESEKFIEAIKKLSKMPDQRISIKKINKLSVTNVPKFYFTAIINQLCHVKTNKYSTFNKFALFNTYKKNIYEDKFDEFTLFLAKTLYKDKAKAFEDIAIVFAGKFYQNAVKNQWVDEFIQQLSIMKLLCGGKNFQQYALFCKQLLPWMIITNKSKRWISNQYVFPEIKKHLSSNILKSKVILTNKYTQKQLLVKIFDNNEIINDCLENIKTMDKIIKKYPNITYEELLNEETMNKYINEVSENSDNTLSPT